MSSQLGIRQVNDSFLCKPLSHPTCFQLIRWSPSKMTPPQLTQPVRANRNPHLPRLTRNSSPTLHQQPCVVTNTEPEPRCPVVWLALNYRRAPRPPVVPLCSWSCPAFSGRVPFLLPFSASLAAARALEPVSARWPSRVLLGAASFAVSGSVN